ncbi:MAG: translocation/assembly module TamB domain-containing protein [Luteolibacter sp.]
MPDIETPPADPAPLPKKRRKLRRWILLAVFLLALVWLNGPGLRWIAPMVASHFLEKTGLKGSFKLEGSLTGGLSISDLRLGGDKDLAGLSVDKVMPIYQLKKLIHGEVDGLTIDGLHADLRLGLKKDSVEKPPLDLAKLVETLRTVRSRIVPASIELKNISLSATRDGKPAFSLAPSNLTHRRGSAEITLELGAITDPTGKTWPAQKSAVLWNADDISIARLNPLPGVSVSDLIVRLPAGGLPSLDTQVRVDEAVFVIGSSPGFAAAKIDLREGKLVIAETAKRFGVEIPATATLTSLAIDIDGVLPDPKAATGSARVLLENVAFKDWSAEEVNLGTSLQSDLATLTVRAKALGTDLSVEAGAPVTRSATRFLLGNATGRFNIASVPAVLAELAKRTPAIDPTAPVPASSLDGNFNLSLTGNRPQAADADLVIKPVDAKLASEISVKGHWQPDAPATAELAVDGLKASAIYEIQPATYQASLDLDEFTNSRIDRWLAIVKVKPGGIADLTGKWSGGGGMKTGRHHGEINFTQATWTRESVAQITAIGGVAYDWPGKVETKGLRVQSNDQTIALEAALADDLLVLKRFLWTDGKEDIAEGTASLPVPKDFKKWREMLANDARPVEVDITSRVLSLGLLKQWLPAAEKIDPRSTGQLQLKVSGTYAEPIVDASLEARDLRSPAQPKLPPADLKVTLKGGDGKLTVDAIATAPDFPAATMKANLPFRPAEWANDPKLVAEESLDARVDLPRLDLSRFSTLVPFAELVTGFLTGNVVAKGKIGKPELKGELNLAGGGMRFKDGRFPAIENLTAAVDLALDKIILKSLKTTVAGGTLTGDGSLAIAAGKPGNLDFKLRGDHLPLMRNDLLILRANIDLRLQGPWEKAALSGTVGAVDSVFYRDIELLPIGTPFNSPSAAALPKIDPPKSSSPAMPEPFRNWGLNVTVRTQEPFLIRGNLATGEVNGSIRVGGTLGNPLPDGSMKISEFRATLPFSTLYVRSGTVSFTPATGFDPILEIRGTAEPRPYRITVYAYGRMSNPQLVLTSNPPLPDNEIMTLLATGTTTTGLENPQAASSRAMQLLAEEIRRGRFRFGKQLRPLLGLLDRVDFSIAEADPYSSDSFSTATLALTDRWFLSAGVGAEGDSRAMVIWRLSFR